MASTVMNWYDNLPSEDMPPRKIWGNPESLDDHFRKVKERWSGKSDEEFREGSWEDAEAGHSVTLKNRYAEYARVSQKLDLDDFMEI